MSQRGRLKRQRGQGMVEFALVSLPFFLLVFGIIDFSVLSASRTATTGATRNAARWAAAHPTAWDNSTTPSQNSIQGRLTLTAVPARIVNDDAHVTILYIVPDSSTTGAICGQYSAASHAGVGGMTWNPGYDNTKCPLAGNFIRIRTTYTYYVLTPMIQAIATTVTIQSEAAELEEVTPSPPPT